MGHLRLEDVRAWQLAHGFTQEVCRLLKGSAVATADMRFSVELFRTARGVEAHIAEAFKRGSDVGSVAGLEDAGHGLAAALVSIEDAIERGYFGRRVSQHALDLGREAERTVRSLHGYLARSSRVTRGTSKSGQR